MEQPDAGAAEPCGGFIEFFKALAVPDRLRVAGVIAAGGRTVAEIAQTLDMPVRAAAAHVGALVAAGYALQEGEHPAARYSWDEARVRSLAKQLDSPRIRALAGATDERSRVLASFVRDGRLLRFPTGEARKTVILDHVIARFDPSRTYTEREINAVLQEFADDYTTIRRALVDRAYLNRQGGVYWLGEGRLPVRDDDRA